MRHCPRCKSSNVSAHYAPANAFEAQEEGFLCGACGLQEARLVTDADYHEWKPRWQDMKPMSHEELAASVARHVEIDDQQEREWTWPTEADPSSYDAVSDRTMRAAKIAEHFE